MNSKLSDGASSSSNHEDKNANLNNEINVSKGAIPKTKTYLKNTPIGRKNVKLNNNFEGASSANCDCSSSNCKNGFSKTLGSYLVNGIHMEKSVIDWESTDVSNHDIYLNIESDSSSSEDNDLSVSDDGCIYTYKADSIPDLPDVFNNLDIPLFGDAPVEPRESTSSPEMDFLEMDFDPEPPMDVENEPVPDIRTGSSNEIEIDKRTTDFQQPCCSRGLENPSLSEYEEVQEVSEQTDKNSEKKMNIKKDIKMPWSCSAEQRTKASRHLRLTKTESNSGEESLSSMLGHDELVKEKIMVWGHEEAYVKQITQIGPSSCSATATLNVLIALRLPVPSLEVICNCRKSDPGLELLSHLQSRTFEGQGHREIISGLDKASNGRIYARFFAMYPERCVNMFQWLGFWIRNGAVPVATLNLQKSQEPVPDSWCHQMIYGVDSDNAYLTNPLESVGFGVLWHQLASESVLLVRRGNIVDKLWGCNDLSDLRALDDPGYDELNVLGQVAKVIREESGANLESSFVTTHIKIPTAFRSGITLAIDRNSKAYPLLLECPELPLLNPCKQ